MSDKRRDNKNRWRSKTVSFRMSPEEAALLDTNASLSGLSKQDYLIDRALQRDIIVQGNPRVFKALRNEMSAVLDELKRIENGNGVDDELIETIRLINTTLDGLKNNPNR